ncbi:MAG TPA: metallophosphoesterase family protein [Solirubrobacterales bacterium]|nr:metallophosphoesterase family protein [Solirubrobacterales bacterium]
MRLLAFSDLHRDLDTAADLAARSADYDVVIGAGDFGSVHEGVAETIAALAAIAVPTLLVPGNNETEDELRSAVSEAGWSAATVLHGERATLDGVEFFGLGAGVPTTPWDWSFDLTEDEAAAMLAECPAGAVLVIHSPPAGHCDRSSAGEHLGSEAIRAAIERVEPPLAVCGHIHEAWGDRSAIGPSAIANLGPDGAEFEL